jgi:hypothetical protein
MIFRDITTVYSGEETKSRYTMSSVNADLLTDEIGGTHSDHYTFSAAFNVVEGN